MINWNEMLAGLEQQKNGLEQELADVDAVILAVRKRSAPSVRVADLTKPRAAVNGRKKPGPKAAAIAKPDGRQSGKLSPDQVVRMGELWESGEPTEKIVARFKITAALLYYYAKSRKWKRPKPGAAAPAAAAPTQTPAGTQLGGNVRCTDPECGAWTDRDPCIKCGKPLKRKGW